MSTILVVDDSKSVVQLLQFDLEEAGYEVVTCLSGEEALKILSTSQFDLILLDVYMPGMTGLELLSIVHKQGDTENVPIIMLSSSDNEEQIVEALDIGAFDYVTKPYIAEILLARIRTALRLQEKTNLLERMATIDFLTQIDNRRHFHDLTSRAIAKCHRDKGDLVVAILDIDHFKNINDYFGHDIGDKVLVALARSLEGELRPSDIIGRLGGEEFGIALPDTSLDDAYIVCDRFRQVVENYRLKLDEKDGSVVNFTVSIGLAALQENDQLGDLLKAADIALYDAKNSGRNKVVRASS